ncbi:TetR family transcriptional regulator [Actinoplanes sp. NPDC051494]|uniref:TetR/AcrR family transcriptional regulator n=1 Tax=Actinoplanes sp. NPDC051494 TaxID=3363907 RepID=UPI0037A02AA8
MTTRAPRPATETPAALCEDAPPARRRDATATKQVLLDAARHRFARHGYSATTVRDIADDAGVNVALISRYFTSKEGLFEACLVVAVSEIGRTVDDDSTLDQVARRMAAQLAGSEAGKRANQMLMLLRSSGDARADQIRVAILRSFAEKLVQTSGDPNGDQILLRAQIAIATGLGMALLRSSTTLEPLSSAGEQDFVEPLQDMLKGLLQPGKP